MKNLAHRIAVWACGLLMASGLAMADTPVHVQTPVVNSSSGVPITSWWDVSATNPFPVTVVGASSFPTTVLGVGSAAATYANTMGCVYTSSPSPITNGQGRAVSCDPYGELLFSLSPTGGGVNGNNFTVTGVVAVTGTQVQLASQVFTNGFSCFAYAAGTDKVSIGPTGVTNPQSVVAGATSAGTYLVNGQGWSLGGNNTNIVFINGTAGDGVQCWGN